MGVNLSQKPLIDETVSSGDNRSYMAKTSGAIPSFALDGV